MLDWSSTSIHQQAFIMDDSHHIIESFKPFSESQIWQLNRNYYQEVGISAWSDGEVPHQITSNSLVGKTYAELILGMLKDRAKMGAVKETMYIVELGAGHGRLAFHILKHLDKLMALTDTQLPPFCYVLSDIVEKNLTFFKEHPQLQTYFEKGTLDYAYYDAIGGKEIHLRHADIHIQANSLQQPIMAIANYFFDSIPNDLLHFKNDEVSVCSIALHTQDNPVEMETNKLLKSLKLTYEDNIIPKDYYSSDISNHILEEYRLHLNDSYLFFPEKSMRCLQNLKTLSQKGLVLLTMDKGIHRLDKIRKKNKPEIITHGSFSLWVNFHALGSYCQMSGGKVLFPSYSTFHAQVGCLMFLKEADNYTNTNAAYQRYVNDFGPDDYNSMKKMTYAHISKMPLIHLLAILRMSAYDSAMFVKMLPQLKVVVKRVSHEERERIAQSLHQIWNFYFNINEHRDMALTIAGFFFDLGFYKYALEFFEHSSEQHGIELDTHYNKTVCYYQLRQDEKFATSLNLARKLFPTSDIFDKLDKLDLEAK